MGTQIHQNDAKSFAETALRLGGKSEAEIRRTATIDRADDQVESFFLPQYQTNQSPVHRVVWDKHQPTELFMPPPHEADPTQKQILEQCLAVVRRHKVQQTLLDDNRKIAEPVLAELGEAGYWGLLVDREHGGHGLPFSLFAPFLTRMATIDPTVAGLASVHGCIGAVDPVRSFGTPDQKARFLPKLASGERLSAFALTEPGAGSDLTALRTRAYLDGDDYVVNGEKLFITNAICGRTIGLVCLIDDHPAVLIVDLPDEENEHFQLVRYGLYALKHTNNNGLRFINFRVPRDNLLTPARGDGLTIAYHGLNLGRVALCAGAAGNMRNMLANLLPWGQYRRTYGHPIIHRELVLRRIARLSALIVGCDALVAWCSWLLDQGYRGEMECTIAKIFGSESQKEAAVELFMKTHGGRSFLHGHLLGDNIHEYLAPCIYEGEGEMLGMAFFKSLVKQHGTTYFEPIGNALADAGIRKPNPLNPAHAWALRKAIVPYAGWWMKQHLTPRTHSSLPAMPSSLRHYSQRALGLLRHEAGSISAAMRRYQLKLADRQCRMTELSQRVQDMITMLVTAMHAGRSKDSTVQMAGEVLCAQLARKLDGRQASDHEMRTMVELGKRVAEGEFSAIAGIPAEEILMPYDNQMEEDQ